MQEMKSAFRADLKTVKEVNGVSTAMLQNALRIAENKLEEKYTRAQV